MQDDDIDYKAMSELFNATLERLSLEPREIQLRILSALCIMLRAADEVCERTGVLCLYRRRKDAP